jgi:hypothetical protein
VLNDTEAEKSEGGDGDPNGVVMVDQQPSGSANDHVTDSSGEISAAQASDAKTQALLCMLAGEIQQLSAQCQENRAEMAEMRAQLVATDKKITSNVSLPSHTLTNSAITVPIPQRVVSASFSDSAVHNIVNNSLPVSSAQPSLPTFSNCASVPSFNDFSSVLSGQLGVQNINSQFSLPGSQSMAAANATSGVNTGVTALMPSLQALRLEPQIAAQAERMVFRRNAQVMTIQFR